MRRMHQCRRPPQIALVSVSIRDGDVGSASLCEQASGRHEAGGAGTGRVRNPTGGQAHSLKSFSENAELLLPESRRPPR